MTTEQFRNSPLIEVVFEIRFPPQLRVVEQRSALYDTIKSQMPVIQVPPSLSEYPALDAFKFQSEDGKQSVQVAMNRFSYHDNVYSGGYPAFKAKCVELMSQFVQLYSITELRRTGLRYVNHIPLVRAGGLIPLQRYLNLEYKAPTSVGTEFEMFGTVLVAKLGDGKLRVLTEPKEVRSSPKSEVIVLDFDYYLENSLKSGSLAEYLEASHSHTKKVFLDLITPEYLTVMRGN